MQDLEAAIHQFKRALLVVEGAGLDAQGIQFGFCQETRVHAGIVGKAVTPPPDKAGFFGRLINWWVVLLTLAYRDALVLSPSL